MGFILFFAFSLLLQGALGELVCEELPVGMCSFSVSSSGKRCSLETSLSAASSTDDDVHQSRNNWWFQCKTSEVVVDTMNEHIESDDCIKACGVDRNSVGISSDSLLESQFTGKLCSDECYFNCPNIVDLYYNLALAEGAFLPDLCKARKVNARREMFQLRSSGHTTAAGPTSAAAAIGSPTSSPGGMLAGGDYAPAPDSSHELYNPYYSWAPTPL
ncbi:hypothetical protein M9H77_06015 [Catharanthus roseus]|uniref:Uncharacterized protein n=1 Tax=Catharanthus roseus TaxID=4058 RepID=A0ACC0BQW7_CATRO|nr:hypothetical protein M9H77_06015 [Catharanthus roseus]